MIAPANSSIVSSPGASASSSTQVGWVSWSLLRKRPTLPAKSPQLPWANCLTRHGWLKNVQLSWPPLASPMTTSTIVPRR